jgi:NCS1 family nucleobase:cation symporter-1
MIRVDLNVAVAYKGPETIKFMESATVPILAIISLALMVWAYTSVAALGKGIPDIFNLPVAKLADPFWVVFLKSLTANIAFWATLALNIPDFSRFAKSQKAQFRGQLFGLPLTMVVFSFVGVFVTGATKLIYGEYIWDPVQVIQMMHSPTASILGGLGIIIATLNMNIAANVVATSNDISNLKPQLISFKTATLITGAAGIAIMPWRLLSSASGFIFGWLGTYGILLGPLAGIYIADYYIHRKKLVDQHSLFSGKEGRYWYKNGFNMTAIYVWIPAAAIPMIGKFVPGLSLLADLGWILGFALGFGMYIFAMRNETASLLSEEENQRITEVISADASKDTVS